MATTLRPAAPYATRRPSASGRDGADDRVRGASRLPGEAGELSVSCMLRARSTLKEAGCASSPKAARSARLNESFGRYETSKR